MKHESTVQADVRLAASNCGLDLWRNNSGAFKDDTGRLVRFGLGNDSKAINDVLKSSDLVGLQSVLITEAHVGMRFARFCAAEIKEEGWVFNPKNPREVAQKAFIDLVRQRGGLAGFAQSVPDFYRILGWPV